MSVPGNQMNLQMLMASLLSASQSARPQVDAPFQQTPQQQQMIPPPPSGPGLLSQIAAGRPMAGKPPGGPPGAHDLAIPESLWAAQQDAQEDAMFYQDRRTQRYRPGSKMGGLESLYDLVATPFARRNMLESQQELAREKEQYQRDAQLQVQDRRFYDAQLIIAENNPHMVEMNPLTREPIYKPGAQAIARQYATSDMTPDQLAKTLFRTYIGIQDDVNKVPRYVGGLKHGEPVYPNVEITPDIQQKLTTETGYRKELNAQLKDFYTVDDSYARVQASHRLDTAAGNLGLIFGTMNMLDPGVSVRKDDYESVASTRGMTEGMVALWQQIMDGKTLTPRQKDELLSLSTDLHTAAQNQAQKTVNSYTNLAKKAGIDVESVIGGYTQRTVGTNTRPRSYNNEQEVYAALANGIIKVGDTVLINGQEILIEEDTEDDS